MILWRISNYNTLDGLGGLRGPGRWHNKGVPIVYLSDHPALALVETLVHLNLSFDQIPDEFQALKVEIPDGILAMSLSQDSLPEPNWRKDQALTRQIGDEWIQQGQSPLLRVPSVLVPEGWNYLFNPRSPEASGVGIVQAISHPFDKRFKA